MTTLANLSIGQGDTITRPLTVTDDDDVPVNLTGATVRFNLRRAHATALAITPAPTLDLTAPAAGGCTLTLTAAQTAALAAGGRYVYEVEITDASGNVTTPVAGLCYVAEDVG
jgi:hypothetical protein